MRKLVFLIGCLLVLATCPAWAQAEPQVIVVRTVETVTKVRLIIARGSGEPEVMEFENGSLDKRAIPAAVGYQRVIATLYAQGYVLQSTVGGSGKGGMDNTATYSTLIFVKAPKP